MDICKDIKHYQDTHSYASGKVDYSVGEHLYMLQSDMTLKIRPGTVGYNNKILVSDEKFILGRNEKVNLAVPHKTNSIEPTTIAATQGLTHTSYFSEKSETSDYNSQ